VVVVARYRSAQVITCMLELPGTFRSRVVSRVWTKQTRAIQWSVARKEHAFDSLRLLAYLLDAPAGTQAQWVRSAEIQRTCDRVEAWREQARAGL
jgi:hypothetical protein